MFFESVQLLFLCTLLAECCLFRQNIGALNDSHPNLDRKPVKREPYRKSLADPPCQCGIPDPNYGMSRTWNLFHVHTKQVSEGWADCLAVPITSNMLLTSHRCFVQPRRKYQPYEAWPVDSAYHSTPSGENLTIKPAGRRRVSITLKEVILHPMYILENPNETHVSDNDLVVLVIEENLFDYDFTSFCLPQPGNSPDAVFYKRGNYFGSGGIFQLDVTTETKYAQDVVIMKAEDCVKEFNFRITYAENSLCVRFRDDPPTGFGGILSMFVPGNGNPQYLVGLSTVVGYEKDAFKYAFFTNILPHIKYIEQLTNRHKSKWCEHRHEFRPPVSVPLKERNLKLYPWEDPAKVHSRVQTIDCVCGLRSEFNPEDTETPILPTDPPTRNFQPRISGGLYARVHEFPWMILITVFPEHNGAGCGGSIINDRMILTAAHCVVYYNITLQKHVIQDVSRVWIWARIHDLRTDRPNAAIKLDAVAGIEKIVVHDEFFVSQTKPSPIGDADVALIILKNSIADDFSSSTDITQDAVKFRPICLPKQSQTMDLVGETAYLSGWGHARHKEKCKLNCGLPSAKLKKSSYPVRSLEECVNFTINSISPNVLCVTSYNVDDSALKGDSGSPLSVVLGLDGLHTQIGLTSFGDEYTDPVHLGTHLVFFTNLQRFIPFIDYHAAEVGAKWCKKDTLLSA